MLAPNDASSRISLRLAGRYRRAALPALAAMLTLSLTAAGCEENQPAATTPVPVTDTTDTTLGQRVGEPTEATSAQGKTTVSTPSSGETVYLSQVRAAAQEGGDRITFEFDGPTVPGYSVAYAPDGVMTGEGTTKADVPGTHQIEVRFSMASTVDLSGGFRQIYSGPTTITPADTATIAGLRQVSDFESVLTWAVGTEEQTPFEVTTMTNPARVVIDFVG